MLATKRSKSAKLPVFRCRIGQDLYDLSVKTGAAYEAHLAFVWKTKTKEKKLLHAFEVAWDNYESHVRNCEQCGIAKKAGENEP